MSAAYSGSIETSSYSTDGNDEQDMIAWLVGVLSDAGWSTVSGATAGDTTMLTAAHPTKSYKARLRFRDTTADHVRLSIGDESNSVTTDALTEIVISSNNHTEGGARTYEAIANPYQICVRCIDPATYGARRSFFLFSMPEVPSSESAATVRCFCVTDSTSAADTTQRESPRFGEKWWGGRSHNITNGAAQQRQDQNNSPVPVFWRIGKYPWAGTRRGLSSDGYVAFESRVQGQLWDSYFVRAYQGPDDIITYDGHDFSVIPASQDHIGASVEFGWHLART